MDSPAKGSLHTQCSPTTSLSFSFFFSLLRSLPTQAKIDFLGLRRVRLNLKNALKFYCIPISLSSFIIIYVSPALPHCLALSPILSVPLFILHPPSSCLSLARFCYVLQFTRRTCPFSCSCCCRLTHVANTVCCLVSVCVCKFVRVCVCWGVCVQIKSHKIKQYPSLI